MSKSKGSKSRFRGWRRSGYTPKEACERCASGKLLVVHHRDRDPTNNDDHTNLETLCRSCHVKEHSAEIAESQRRDDVNARRGASISRARKGGKYPKDSAAITAKWAEDEYRAKMVAARNTPEYRKMRSDLMRAQMNDPEHLAKRKAMKDARRAKP